MGARLRTLTTAGLLLAAGALASRFVSEPGLAGAEPARPEPDEVAAALAEPVELPPPATFVPPSGDSLNELTDRPPFSPSRRPTETPTAAAPDAAAPSASRPDFALLGINLGPNERAALVRPPGNSRPQWVRERELVRGWRVVTIQSDRLVVEAGGNRVELGLRAR